MTVTAQWLNEWFTVFNRDYFSSRLPRPLLKVSHARTRLGQMTCKCQTKALRTTRTDFAISVSDYYDMTDLQAKSVLLHEMIHYFIVFNNIRDTSPHGEVFRRMADELNSRYGWQIHVRENTKGWKPREEVPQRQRRQDSEFLILALTTDDGRYFLSRVSRRYAGKLEQQMAHAPTITSHGWYLSSDTYFSSFTEVRSLRGRRVPAEEFAERCASMSRLK